MAGATQRPTRVKELHVVAPGAEGAGHAPSIGSGGIVPVKIVIPATQSVDAFQIVTAAGATIFSISNIGSSSSVIAAAPTAITANGAVAVRPTTDYVITKAGVAALTLAAPTTGTDDGVTITITSTTAFAHTLTATGLLQTGSSLVDVATFAPYAGASITLRAYLAKWIVVATVGVTFGVVAPTAITADGAVPVRPSTNYVITKAGVAVLTLAAPTTGADDGVILTLTSTTANAHTLTATGLFQTGSSAVNLATFAAFAGASVTLRAYLAKWIVVNSVGITFS